MPPAMSDDGISTWSPWRRRSVMVCVIAKDITGKQLLHDMRELGLYDPQSGNYGLDYPAELFGVTAKTVENWLWGRGAKIPQYVVAYIELAKELHAMPATTPPTSPPGSATGKKCEWCDRIRTGTPCSDLVTREAWMRRVAAGGGGDDVCREKLRPRIDPPST